MFLQSRLMAPAVLGAATIATSAIMWILQIVLALPHSAPASSTRIAAILAAILECAALALLSWILIRSSRRSPQRTVTALCLGCASGLCAVAAAVTVAALVCLSSNKTIGADTTGYLAGTAIMLALSLPLQSLFLASRFVADRATQYERSNTPGMQEIGRRSPTTRVKTVPYSRTSPPPESHTSSRTVSMDSRRPPDSSGDHSTRSTIYSMASSVETLVRAASSKTRLLSGKTSNPSLRSQRSQHSQRSRSHSQRSARRALSMESFKRRERSGSADDSFDSWDTSGVDPQNRQLVIETTSPVGGGGNGRFLETIPASPTTSRSPSPGLPLDQFDLPHKARRSRSFSPATSTRSVVLAPPKRAYTQQTSASESHIHPLFRSDSPTPPPMASPGTVVIAAPQAGKIISDRKSVRSFRRLRSGSLPAVSSPLTATNSLESFARANGGRDHKSGSIIIITTTATTTTSTNNKVTSSSSSNHSMRSDETAVGEVPERKITPPVPEYILNAGSHTSLHAYPARKTPSRDGPRGPGLGALDAAW